MQAKCISITGSKAAAGKIVKAVTQKVQAIQESSEFVQRVKTRAEYLAHFANQPVTVPAYWTSVTSLQDESAHKMRVPADPSLVDAIKGLVQRTWDASKAGAGSDAKGLSHTTIEVTSVEQIENPNLHLAYGHRKGEFCTRAANGSFEKVTSDPGEPDVLTSTLGISELDDQLIPEINEYFLFHGAQQQYIEPILKQGIDFRLNTRAMFGRGAYFAESSTKADQYAGNKYQSLPAAK